MIAVLLASGLYFILTHQLFDPMIASLAMSCSSLFVVTNALRLKKVNLKIEKEKITNMKKVMTIEGMMCMHCAKRVKDALETLPGVTADINLDNKTATVIFENEVV